MAYPPPPYKDAKCGTPLCGEAICGTWWAYPARGTLTLNARPVTVVLDATIKRAALLLSGRQVTLHFSSTFAPQRGLLRLVGSNADFVGQEFLFPLACSDVSLSEASCNGEMLAPAPVQELVMASLDCR